MKFVKCFVAAFVLYTAVLTTHAAPRVVCYFTNWSYYRSGIGKFSPSNIDKNLCTNIVYSFSILNSDQLIIQMQDPNVDVTQKFYQQVTAFKKNGIKVSLALGGWSDSVGDKYSRLLNNAAARKNFITNAVKFIQANNFDGLDLDLEVSCYSVVLKMKIKKKYSVDSMNQFKKSVFLFQSNSTPDVGKEHAKMDLRTKRVLHNSFKSCQQCSNQKAGCFRLPLVRAIPLLILPMTFRN